MAEYALSFDGNNQYVELPDIYWPENGEIEYKFSATTESNVNIISQHSTTKAGVYHADDGRVIIYFDGDTNNEDFNVGHNFLDGTVYTIRVVFNKPNFEFYVNGSLEHSGSNGGTWSAYINGIMRAATRRAPGEVHYVKVVDDDDPANNYFYELNDGTGITIESSSEDIPYQNIGTLNNPVWLDLGDGNFAVQFDGVDDVIDIPTFSFSSNKPYIIEARVRCTNDFAIIGSEGAFTAYTDAVIVQNDGVYVQRNTGASYTITDVSLTLHDGNWHTIKIESTDGPDSLIATIDGQEIGTESGGSFGSTNWSILGGHANSVRTAGDLDYIKITDIEAPTNSRYYKLNEGTGTTTIDSKEVVVRADNGVLTNYPQSNTGTLSGNPEWGYLGNSEYGINFDGVDDYITIPTLNLQWNQDYTIEARVRCNENFVIIGTHTSYVGYVMVLNDGVRFRMNTSNTYDITDGALTLHDGIWHKIKLESLHSQSKTVLTVDDVYIGEISQTFGTMTWERIAHIGSAYYAGSLSSVQITDHTTPANNRDYTLNEGVGDTVIDESVLDDTHWILISGAAPDYYVDYLDSLNPIAYWQLGDKTGTTIEDYTTSFNGTTNVIAPVASLIASEVPHTQTIINIGFNDAGAGSTDNSGVKVVVNSDNCLEAIFTTVNAESFTDSLGNSDTSHVIKAITNPIDYESWFNVFASFSSDTISVYLDTVSEVTTTLSSETKNYFSQADDCVSIGVEKRIGSDGINPLKGSIDEVIFYPVETLP